MLAFELMDICSQEKKHVVRSILFGVARDLSAGRKSCRFLGHFATLGCTRCLKQFPGAVGSKDYSGKPRTNSDHRSCVDIIQKARTKTEI